YHLDVSRHGQRGVSNSDVSSPKLPIPFGRPAGRRALPIYVFRGGDERWRASVAELPGCFASGATRDEAIAGARLAVREYRALLAARDVTVEHAVDPDALEVREPPEQHILPEDLAPMEEHEIRDF